jgi:hypothetical protein
MISISSQRATSANDVITPQSPADHTAPPARRRPSPPCPPHHLDSHRRPLASPPHCLPTAASPPHLSLPPHVSINVGWFAPLGRVPFWDQFDFDWPLNSRSSCTAPAAYRLAVRDSNSNPSTRLTSSSGSIRPPMPPLLCSYWPRWRHHRRCWRGPLRLLRLGGVVRQAEGEIPLLPRCAPAPAPLQSKHRSPSRMPPAMRSPDAARRPRWLCLAMECRVQSFGHRCTI